MKSVLPFPSIVSCTLVTTLLYVSICPVWAQEESEASLGRKGRASESAAASFTSQRVIAMTDAERRAYILGVGDLIAIEVLNHEELSGNFQVKGDGYIHIPGGKPIAGAGKAIWKVETLLKADLAKRIVSPVPKIQLLKRADIYVTIGGEVRSTGRKTLSAESHLQDIIAEAGSITAEKPEWAEAVITRKGRVLPPIVLSDILSNVSIDQNLELMDGDSVLIRRRSQTLTHINVSGMVRSPGTFPLPADKSLLSAVSLAGGLLPDASMVHGEILRGTEKIPIDLTKEGSKLRDIQMQPGDTLYIPANPSKFAVMGAVSQPGPKNYPENETVTILRAVTISGGVQTEIADLKHSTLYRATSDGKDIAQTVSLDLEPLLKKGNLSKDIEIRPGDILYIPTKRAKRSFDTVDALQLLPVLFLFRQVK